MTEPPAKKLPLTARLDMRFAAPLRNVGFARRTWFSVTVALILCAHAALLAALLWRDNPVQIAKAEETPVEVVVEPPPPPEPPKPAPPKPAAHQEVEKPATSAPRAVNTETVDHQQASDKDTHAPKAVAAKAEAPPPAAADDKPQAEAPPPKPDVTEKDAEALDALPPEPPKRPAELTRPKPAKPVKTAAKTAVQQLAGASDLPDFTFAKPMRKAAKVSGGTEDNRYLAVVFGMIMQNRRPIPMPPGAWEAVVAFEVDAHGNLLGVGLQHSSGYRFVDAAAVEAVQRAAPFPPPPSGASTGLVAKLQSGPDPRRAMLTGDD